MSWSQNNLEATKDSSNIAYMNAWGDRICNTLHRCNTHLKLPHNPPSLDVFSCKWDIAVPALIKPKYSAGWVLKVFEFQTWYLTETWQKQRTNIVWLMSPTDEVYRAERNMTTQLQTPAVRLKFSICLNFMLITNTNLNSGIMYTIRQNRYIEIYHTVVGIKYAACPTKTLTYPESKQGDNLGT